MTSSRHVLGVSGGLHNGSVNSMFLIAPEDTEFKIYKEVGSLPLFNPDLQDGRLTW